MLVAVFMQVMLPLALQAQRSGIIGTVADTLGGMLGNVQVELSGTDYGSITNSAGEFRLLRVQPGPYTLYMRRIGFQQLSMPIVIKAGDAMNLDFELTPTLVRLAEVSVKASRISDKLRRVGFESRAKSSGLPPSRFITRADLERQNPMTLNHLLERQGGRVRNCVDALVYMDGVPPLELPNNLAVNGPFTKSSSLRPRPRSANTSQSALRPLESVPVSTVDGMEIYASLSEIPAEFRPGYTNVSGRCVILVWTRER